MSDRCPICSSPGKIVGKNGPNSFRHECSRCGKFSLTEDARIQLYEEPFDDPQKVNASGRIRENEGIEIDKKVVESLRNLKTPTVAEKANKLLLYFSKSSPIPGHFIIISINDPSLLGVSWAQSDGELLYLLQEYLSKTKRFIEIFARDQIRITPDGWAYIDSLKQINPDSQIGFIAMSFHKDLTSLLTEAIYPAIEAAGYQPVRIDRHNHSNTIDHEILAVIRRSRFVVADFTKQSKGVYFEAGFALGLGLPVYWLCQQKEIDDHQLHFDTRQYPHTTWEDGKWHDLKKKLKDRIEAHIGHGKYEADMKI